MEWEEENVTSEMKQHFDFVHAFMCSIYVVLGKKIKIYKSRAT